MNTTSTAFQPVQGAEPIPGYVLEECIGNGGYGEVWKATAPGGLTKAIKFVYGRLRDAKASRELKSLNRVKAVNHPFILTLERIEVVADHLMIVTEIADLSLRERFEQCRDSGLPAIPRDELLRVLGEAADALDYLFTDHSLQHLDVKPENLLLVGKHVKIADFGLLKDLHDVSLSLVSGFTPRYAPPELFDGRPDRNSDQYSLAVVYQEMATGKCPFDGMTAAALASQHLLSPPDLSPLTPAERYAVGRALSKDPNRRFGSCAEFIARLAPRTTAPATVKKDHKPSAKGTTSPAAGPRAAGPDPPASDSTNRLPLARRHDGQTIAFVSPEVSSLPALDLDGHKAACSPTVFVGVGHTGGLVLRRLRRLLTGRFGDVAALPAFQFLLIDTDAASITQALSWAHRGGLQERETLAAPIRHSWDYRNAAVSSLPSISRRWIYNVPRSLRTEGLRALGRLALLDHSQQILKRLGSAVMAASEAEAIASTSEKTGLSFRGSEPSVYLVASIAGGTGGGMVVDLAYAVRQVLAESGLPDEEVYGILAYATRRGESRRGLAPANAVSCLDELQYFSLPGNHYPGEPACGLAAFPDDAPTFTNTYLMDLGDDLTDGQFAAATDRLAHYLLLSGLPPASSFFHACRELERRDEGGGQLRLRTTGLATLGGDVTTIAPQWPRSLCKLLVRSWLAGTEHAADENRVKLSDYARRIEAPEEAKPDDAGSDDADLDGRVTRRAAELGMAREPLARRLRNLLRDELGSDCDAYFRNLATKSFNNALAAGGDPAPAASTTVRTMHAVFGIEGDSDPELSHRIESLRDLAAPKAEEIARELGKAVHAWVRELVDAPDARVLGAQRVVKRLDDHLDALKAEAVSHVQRAGADREAYARELRAACAGGSQKKAPHQEAVAERLSGYVGPLVEQVVSQGVREIVGLLRDAVSTCADHLGDLSGRLARLGAALDDQPDADDESAAGAGSDEASPAADVFRDRVRSMVEQFDRRVQEELVGPERRLFDALPDTAELRVPFAARMREQARQIVLRHVGEAALARLRRESREGGGSESPGPLHECLEAATPDLLVARGGKKRLLLVVPDDAIAASLREEVQRASGDEATVVCDPRGELLVCYEGEDVGMDGVYGRLVNGRPDCQNLASRLHTRVDINW